MKQIIKTVVVLLALVLAHTLSDLVRQSLEGTQDGVVLHCTSVAKQSRPGNFKTQEVFITNFEEVLCPVTCLEYCERQTKAYRKSSRLFLAKFSLFNPVSSSSIVRWTKDILKEAGLGVFNTFSSREAAATAACLASQHRRS